METLADVLQYVQIAAFVALAAVCFRQWRARRDEPAFWALLTFGLLGAVVASGPVTNALAGDDPPEWLDKLVIALILLFPYFLFRFAASFGWPSRRVELAALALTAAVVVWAAVLPTIPQEGEPRPDSFVIFIFALLFQWSALSLWVALRLWRAGRRQPTVVRYRMRILAAAAVGLSLVLILAGVESEDPPAWVDVVNSLLVLAVVLLFFVGFAPPRALRKSWRDPEEEMLRRSVDDLLTAESPEAVLSSVLPQMAAIVGAEAVALTDESGAVVGSHGVTPELEAEFDAAPAQGVRLITRPRPTVIDLPATAGTVIVWTTPYAPFFGSAEFELLRTLGTFAQLALERSGVHAQEREARLALQQADEMKTQFVALASHELRAPAGVIHGIAQTLFLRADELQGEQLDALRRTLYEQTERMRRLVDQLLDLSRLEADAVRIDPQPFWVRNRVEEIVLMVGSEREHDMQIDVATDLEAVADPDAFDRIVSNLIVNAFRYGAPPVRVHAEQRDRHFRVTVEDRGRGVPTEFVPLLFDRFSRSETAREEKGGAGLGLAIAKSYAHAHGGDLIYHDAEPHGARFELVLPRSQGTTGQ
ncbi:MAG: sensor histidine kinase [Gaiellaceae bacterium]